MKHRFQDFVTLHNELASQLAPLIPLKFPFTKLALTGHLLSAASRTAAKQRRTLQLQAFLRQLVSAAARRGAETGTNATSCSSLLSFIDVNSWHVRARVRVGTRALVKVGARALVRVGARALVGVGARALVGVAVRALVHEAQPRLAGAHDVSGRV